MGAAAVTAAGPAAPSTAVIQRDLILGRRGAVAGVAPVLLEGRDASAVVGGIFGLCTDGFPDILIRVLLLAVVVLVEVGIVLGYVLVPVPTAFAVGVQLQHPLADVDEFQQEVLPFPGERADRAGRAAVGVAVHVFHVDVEAAGGDAGYGGSVRNGEFREHRVVFLSRPAQALDLSRPRIIRM